jgi:hypothetical protein
MYEMHLALFLKAGCYRLPALELKGNIEEGGRWVEDMSWAQGGGGAMGGSLLSEKRGAKLQSWGGRESCCAREKKIGKSAGEERR